MASKSGQQEAAKPEVVEELLDALDAALDRVKVLYEQYFLGIQKQPPTYLHTDVERKIRDLAQLQVRNTALRYRFATLQQKFGSYNAYWRRTLRQIESGTYTRSLSKIGRQAARTGAAVPEEILAAMPKRMREQVQRDREAALAVAARRTAHSGELELLTLVDEDLDVDDLDPAFVQESAELRRHALIAGGVHKIAEADADFDLDAFFASVASEAERSSAGSPGQAARAPASQPRGLLDAPVIRGPAPTSQAEPCPPQEARSEARATAYPRPGSAPGAVTGAPTGPRPIPPRVVTPPVGGTASQALPRISVLPPSIPATPKPVKPAPSQATRPIPISPGASAARAPSAVATLAGPFPRLPSLPPLPARLRAAGGEPPAAVERPSPVDPASPAPPADRAAPARTAPDPAPPVPVPASVPPPPPPHPTAPRVVPGERSAPAIRQAPPPGMSEADVDVLYAKYVQAKQTLGEEAGPGAYGKLLKTIHAQAPKIMEQYKSQGVDFSVIVKDNQVIVRAKPKP